MRRGLRPRPPSPIACPLPPAMPAFKKPPPVARPRRSCATERTTTATTPSTTNNQTHDLVCADPMVVVGLRVSVGTQLPAYNFLGLHTVWVTCATPIVNQGVMPPRVEWQNTNELPAASTSIPEPADSKM